jgi:hypothetical protein
MTRFKQVLPLMVSLAAAGLVVVSASPAAAQDQAAIDKLVQMNKKALEDYDTLDMDSAKRTLLDALMAGKKAGLENHPVMARTYVHLGAVYMTGFKNRDKAIASFARALEIDPNIQLSKGIATSDVNDAFAEAQRRAKAGGGGGGGSESAAPVQPLPKRRRGPVMEDDSSSSEAPAARPRRPKAESSEDDESGEPDLPIRINALDCPEPDEAILEKPVTLRCALSPKLPVSSVYLLYRAPGKEDYSEVEMKKTPKGWYQGKIPKKAVVGKSIQFFFEGRNDAGKPVVANGGHDSPNIMLIVEESEKGKTAGGDKGDNNDEEENPLDEDGRPKRPKIRLGQRQKNEDIDVRFGKRRFWIGLGAGSGYGYAKGNGLEAVNMSNDPQFHALQSVFSPGLAWAGVAHLAPEFGYAITPDIAIALEGRLQWIPQSSTYQHYAARGALSVLAKLMYFTEQSQIRFFGSVLAGGGEGVRFTVQPAAGATVQGPNGPMPASYQDFTDTIHGGPILAGVGGGMYYEASRSVSLVVEVNALTALPLFAAFGDLNLALQFNIY